MTSSIYQGWAVDAAGDIIPNPTITVRDNDTNALVTLWSNRATTSTKTNPFTGDADGYFFFYRTAGRYKIEISDGVDTVTLVNVQIGTASEHDVGTDADDIPLISDLADVALSGEYDDLLSKPALGTAAFLDAGTASGEVRTNTQNDGRFLRIANNLNDLENAGTARSNLGLGTMAVSTDGVSANAIPYKSDSTTFSDSGITIDGNGAATFTGNGPTSFEHDVDVDGGITVDTIDTGQGAVECYAMDQAVRTTDVPTFGNASADGHVLNRVTGDGRYGRLGSANSWTGDQTVTGGFSATGLVRAGASAPDSWDTSSLGVALTGLAGSTASRTAGAGVMLGNNVYFDGDPGGGTLNNARYMYSTLASVYLQVAGYHSWWAAPSGTADASATFTEQMRLLNNGNLHVGGTSDPGVRLGVTGAITATTHIKPGSYTVATQPSAATAGAGASIYVTDGNAGAACYAVSNGTNWKVIALGATISAT